MILHTHTILWLIGGLISAPFTIGWTLAYWQEQFWNIAEESIWWDRAFAYFWGISGILWWPAQIVFTFLVTKFAKHGWRYW